MSSPAPLRIAILGSGHVGMDLLYKVRRSSALTCALVAGRRLDSDGLVHARSLGVPTVSSGISGITERAAEIDLVFDVTSAGDAASHWVELQAAGLPMVDLTPARLGPCCIPVLNLKELSSDPYVSMLSCGGQAALPIAHCISRVAPEVQYVEIVSTAASPSVGAGTRSNMDEYIVSTESTVKELCGIPEVKTILLVSPAEPPVTMTNTIAFSSDHEVDLERLSAAVVATASRIQSYVPGYRVALPPTRTADRTLTTITVEGRGDWLPTFAGNLDIITCAAVAVAEARAAASPA